MGLADKINSTTQPTKKVIENPFTLAEIDILIRVLGTATFPVKEIEPLYVAIYKMQELRKNLINDGT